MHTKRFIIAVLVFSIIGLNAGGDQLQARTNEPQASAVAAGDQEGVKRPPLCD